MDQCIDALSSAYLDFSSGVAVTRQRSDTLVPSGESVYGLKTMDGIAPGLDVGAVRINSDIVTWPKVGDSYRRVKVPAALGSRYTGLILVFSTEMAEPLAIMPDGVIQRMRVGATSALGTHHLAKNPEDSGYHRVRLASRCTTDGSASGASADRYDPCS